MRSCRGRRSAVVPPPAYVRCPALRFRVRRASVSSLKGGSAAPPATETLLEAHMLPLDEAVIDAGMLLVHAARCGLTLQPENTAAIVSIRGGDEVTVERETRFWPAFSALAKLVQPVTVRSLKAALPHDGAAP